MGHSRWFLRYPLCRGIFLAATLALVLPIKPSMAQCEFCYLQVLNNSHSDLAFLPCSGFPQLLQFPFPSTFQQQCGCFEPALPVTSSSSLQLLWHIPLLPAPPQAALSLPFPVNQLSSLCGFISDHIFSSDFAHWVFREELRFSVLVFKSYEPSGPAERQLK